MEEVDSAVVRQAPGTEGHGNSPWSPRHHTEPYPWGSFRCKGPISTSWCCKGCQSAHGIGLSRRIQVQFTARLAVARFGTPAAASLRGFPIALPPMSREAARKAPERSRLRAFVLSGPVE